MQKKTTHLSSFSFRRLPFGSWLLHFALCLLPFAFCFLPFSGQAQTYPVTISTQLTQPSPIYLSNYANTTSINSPIKVQLILNDLTIMNRQVRLKCYFQGAVSFVSNDFVVGASPIYLEGGFPTLLTNVELGPYFEFQNLQGVNPNQYAQPLPEGIYTISFEVFDFATNKKLSKKSSVTTIIFQNEPPFLNLPVNKAEIVEQNIQNIIFSWTPRSINVSNVEYEFSLVEIWNTNTPLQNAFAYSPPLYTTTTRNTTVQYSIAEPQLIPGKTYAWRVKAKALVGAEEIGVFKNNGYSEIFSFKYLTFCKAPLAITTTDVSQDQAKVTWSGEVDNYDYQVNYREKNADSKWYKLVTPREYITISNLKPKTAYEYTVGAACDPGEYTHSNIQEFTTLAQDEIAFVGCGIKPDPAAQSNKTPLPALFPNDVVTAGDFPIVVLKSTGSNGTFSGEGYVTLPFLDKFRELIDAAAALAGSDEKGDSKANIGKYTRIRITFKNIGVNTDFKLISGEIVASYDPKWGSMVDGDKLVNDIMGDTGTVIPLDVQFEIKSVVKNADGTLTITGTNGVIVQQPKTDNDVIITDRNGNQYAVSPNSPAGEIKSTGKVAPGGIPTPQNTNGMGSGGNIKEISSPDITITFAAGAGFYSLDENPNQDPKLKANTKLNNTYDIIPKKDGTSYYVHYKVISDAPKAEDYVTAKATFSNGKTTADIVFKTENGTEIPSTWSGNVATLSLKRTLDFAKESILATVKPPVQKDSVKVSAKYDIAGTLNMWHVTGKKVNVTLVGLNGGETPTQKDAQDYLDSIYGKAGIQFEVSTTKVDITDSWGASIETGDSDLLNTYTDGQQTITNNFQTQLGASYKNDTYYVLFTKAPSSKSGILGFMPLKRQFGFVFAPPSRTGGLRTLAHELGHGIFGLQHPFTEYNTTATTDLLMDYGTGTALNHNDWEIMHAPGLQLYQFTQGSNAGAQIASDYNYLMPNNLPFRFIKDEGKLETDKINIISTNNGGYANGTLYAFDINGKEYEFNTTKTPQGYYEPNSTTPPYANAYSKEFATQKFRLIIQQSPNSCNYYLAVRLKINFKTPDLMILEGDKISPITNCSKIKINDSEDVALNGDIACQTDPYNQKSLFTYNNEITTYGEKIVFNINNQIQNNEKNSVNKDLNSLETDLNNLKLGNNQYISGVNHSNSAIFSPSNIEELNDKLAFLKVSSGVELYIHFEEKNCTYSETEGQNFANKIFKNSNLAKNSKAIFVLVSYNNYAKNDKNRWSTYLVFGSDISPSIQANATKLIIGDTNSFKIYGANLIEFYKSVPKKQLQYNFLIEEATTEDEAEATLYNYVIKKILLKKIVTQNIIGNAIQHNYYLRKIVDNKIADFLISDKKELKEQYVKDDGIVLANIYSADSKIGRWRYTRMKKEHLLNVHGDNYESAGVNLHIFDCDFSGDITCKKQAIDTGFLIASIAVIPVGASAVLFVDAVAVGYYISQGEIGTAAMYLSGFVLGPILGEAFDAAGKWKSLVNTRKLLNEYAAGFKNLSESERVSSLIASEQLLNKLKTAIGTTKYSKEESKTFQQIYDLLLENRIKCTNIHEELSTIVDITVENGAVLFNYGSKAGQKIADVSISESVLNLSNITSWLPSTVSNVKLINTFTTISYINKSGQAVNGALEIVEDLNKKGTLYVTPKLLEPATLASRLESASLLELKNKVNTLGTLKPKFLEDFANADDAVLKELDDIVRFEDDYTAFQKLWKNSIVSDVKNYSTDINKFKNWWYPNKAKVNNEFFINQKAYELSLNSKYLEDLHLEKISSNVRGQYWNYYKQSQWDKLEALAKEYKINFDSYSNALWPPANGGYGQLVKRTPNMNEVFDRYGGSFGDLADGTPNLGGTYTSPMLNDKPYDFDGRALNIERNKYDFYYKIIIKDPSKFEIETNKAIPWFGKIGKAEQSRFIIKDLDPTTGRQKTWSQLASEGSVEIQVIESPSGKYSTWVGKGRTISKTPTGGVNTLSELKGLGFTDDVASKIITKNKSLNLSDAEIKTLMQDLKNNSNLMKTVNQNPENGIDAWKIFTDNKKAFCE
ncbi:Fibronectin type III [Flavobacteriaceae bacterium]